MDQKLEEINMRQFNMMKHAIGLDRVGAKPKRGKYIAYRNYFCVYGNDVDWDKLIERGVATYNDVDPSRYYHVSMEGIEFMENVLGFKIVLE